jgi:hypothetical protein
MHRRISLRDRGIGTRSVLLSWFLCAAFGCSEWAAKSRTASDTSTWRKLSEGDNQAALLTPAVTRLPSVTVSRGGRHELDFHLSNTSPMAVEITQIQTSCDCLRIALPQTIIRPGEKVAARARTDFADDPSFAGRLALEATASAKGSSLPAFIVYADVVVEE